MSRVPSPLAQLALSALNHVLKQQPRAREQMRVHAGRGVRVVVVGPLGHSVRSDARIDADGLLALAGGVQPAAVLFLTAGLDAVFGAMKGGAAGLRTHIKVEGDVMLAGALGQVARSLRWDFEEDLSRLVGDGIANRVGQVLRGVGEAVRGMRFRSREALQRNAGPPDGPLVSSTELAGMAAEIERLRARLGRLETRALPPSGGGSVHGAELQGAAAPRHRGARTG